MKLMPALLAVTMLLAGCAGASDPTPGGEETVKEAGFQQITQEEAMRIMAEETGYVILDVRTKEEYDGGHIPGAVCVPNELINCDAPEALPDYDQLILVYCRSGNRSKQAAQKLAEAEHKAAELDKNTRSELRLFAEQSVNALKTEVANLLTDKLAADSVKAATADPKFMQQIIAGLAAQLAKNGEVVIEAKDAEALKKYFAQNAKELLDKGVEIKEVKGIRTDFSIAPKDGGYKLAFGDAEFIAYFKEFLRPQLIELLF